VRSRLVRRSDAAIRWCLARGVGRLRGDLLVNEYPKSGGSWIAGMLGEALDMPFPRNRHPTLRRCVLHGHALPGIGRPRSVIVWRDGRDVMVSWYHHCMFPNDRENRDLVAQTRAALQFDDPRDVRENLPTFIDYAFGRQAHPGFSWSAFADAWLDHGASVHTSYEAMRGDPVTELRRVLSDLDAPADPEIDVEGVVGRHSFAAQAGRDAGTEKRGSFLRKGIVGDWKNHFSRDAREVFHRCAGDALIRLGYASGPDWVTES